MNNKEYFEKSIIPYRQKIRQLESENLNLKIDKFKLKEDNERLNDELYLNKEHIERMFEYMEMNKSDLLNMVNRDKAMSKLNSLLDIFRDPYHL